MVEKRSRISGRLILGTVVIALGALWTLDNLGYLDSEEIVRWWPTVLIAVGVGKLFGFLTPRNTAAGTILVVVGAWLLAGGLGVGWVDLSLLWPLILVAVGIHLVLRSYRAQSSDGASDDLTARLSTFAIWSAIDRKVSSQVFRGGDVTAVMGSVKIDFSQAKPVPEGAVIDLFVWWGGVELKVPEDWKVVFENVVMMGGVDDKAKNPPPETPHVLILRGVVIMGGVEIKN